MTDVVSRAEVSDLFSCLTGYTRLVLGVSGGADSLCLMHMIADWMASSSAEARPNITVVTIDHGLRATSSAEATEVARRAHELGFACRVLAWGGPKPHSGLQAEARAMRYTLLAEAAKGDGQAAVVVAHTQDDQAETLLMRLKRGSGIDGLAGMSTVRPLAPGVDLVRPLLSVARRRIEATLRARGVTWIDDPSNANALFERVRVRTAQGARDELGLSDEMLALTAKRARRAHLALEAAASEFLGREARLHNGAFASLDLDQVLAAPEDIRVRVCDRLIRAFGDGAEPALLSQVEALVEKISMCRPCRLTLGGAIVSAGPRLLRIYREPARLAADPVELPEGGRLLWDGRFWVSSEEGASKPFQVAPLGSAGTASVDATLAAGGLSIPPFAADWPRTALLGLPAVWTGSRLIAVPHFDQDQVTDRGFRVTFLGLGRGTSSRGLPGEGVLPPNSDERPVDPVLGVSR